MTMDPKTALSTHVCISGLAHDSKNTDMSGDSSLYGRCAACVDVPFGVAVDLFSLFVSAHTSVWDELLMFDDVVAECVVAVTPCPDINRVLDDLIDVEAVDWRGG